MDVYAGVKAFGLKASEKKYALHLSCYQLLAALIVAISEKCGTSDGTFRPVFSK